MTSGIYTIVNKVNGHRYIGSSQDLEHRFNYHKSALRRGVHDNTHLQRAWKKYGENNFIFEIVELCTIDSLIEMEQRYLDMGCEYNMAKVAGSPMRGMSHSFETLVKISSASRNISEETREKLRIAGRKRRQTEEEKQKIREKATGRKCTEAAKIKIGLAARQRKHSEETKRRISQSLLNKSPEDKERISKLRAKGGLGHKITEEKRKKLTEGIRNMSPEKKAERARKISEAQLKHWAKKRQLQELQ